MATLEYWSSRLCELLLLTLAETVIRFRALRETSWLLAWRICRVLGVSPSTVGAWLRRLGFYCPLIVARLLVQRYEWLRSGDLIYFDI